MEPQARISELFGEPALLFKDKINLKLPGAGAFEPHQDMQAGWASYADYFITVLVALDPATQANGCLEIVPGHHKRGLIGAEWRSLTEEQIQGMEFIPFEAAPGDALFFDSYVPHRSHPNLSKAPRRALYITYNRRSEGDNIVRYYIDKRKAYPPDCERVVGRSYAFRV